MKVILYFFVAGVNFVSSMYGFLPPIFAPSTRKLAGLPGENHRDAENAEGRRYKTEFKKPCHPEGWRYKSQKRKIKSKSKFKGAGRRPAVQKSDSEWPGKMPATTDCETVPRRCDKLNIVEAFTFQRRLQCAVH
jgi:hypothetical protein